MAASSASAAAAAASSSSSSSYMPPRDLGTFREETGTVASRTSRSSTNATDAELRKVGHSVRDVDRASLAVYRALRHFNVSVPVPRLEETFAARFMQQDEGGGKKTVLGRGGAAAQPQPLRRKLLHTSTHKLDSLTKSSFGEFDEVKSFKKLLIDERAKQRKQEMELTQKLIGVSASAPTSSGSPGRVEPRDTDPLRSAKEKLGVFSQSFEPKLPDNQIWIGGFHGARLTMDEFKVQIMRCLQLKLSTAEMEALFNSFEIDVFETIDGVHFTRLFFTLGHQYRHAVLTTSLQNVLLHEREEKRKKDEEAERVRRWEAEHVSSDGYTPEDEEVALSQMRSVAMRKEGAVATDKFEAFLTPAQFKMQLFKSFGMELTKKQTAVLIDRYLSKDLLHKKIEHCIDGRKMLIELKGRFLLEAKKEQREIEHARAAVRQRTQAASRTEYTLNLPLGR
jgi:hypothetical protein